MTNSKRIEVDSSHKPKFIDLYDPLTGVLSRRSFFHVVGNEIVKAKSEGANLALLIINIVGFRRINLSAGNAVGDLVLCETANRIRNTFRSCDSVARLGNDEFAALLPSMISEDHSTLAIHKILRVFEKPIEVNGQQLNIQLSVGVALYSDACINTDQLIRNATIALLHAGDRGRPYSIYCGGTKDGDLASYAYGLELRSAVDQNQLILHYQPKWDISTGHISAAEALVRWPHKDHGMIGPNKFIPIAEESNLIWPLTSWVINEAVRQCAAWHRDGMKLCISVNLSTKVLDNPDLPGVVTNALEIWSLNSEYLTLEVTETAIMEHWEQGLDILHGLSSLGVSISIDDFGAGYSSFAYLCNLPVHELKVDKTIVDSVEGTTDKETVLRTIIDLGHNLGLIVTAEGVEDGDTYRSLEQLGCDMIQGYLISPPVTADQFTALIQNPISFSDC